MNLQSQSLASAAMGFFEFAATWWLQAGVLLIAAFGASCLLRRQGPAVHSVILRVALCAVLLSPIVTKAITLAGISTISIDIQTALLNSPEETTADTEIESASLPNRHSLGDDAIEPIGLNADQVASMAANMQSPRLDGATEISQPINEQAIAPDLNADQSAAELDGSSIDTDQAIASLTWVFAIVASIWGLGAAILFGRLVRDLLGSRSLVASSVSSDELAVEVCRKIATKLNLRTPDVKCNPFVNSPCLLGHWQPTILLPEDTHPSTYSQVFLHELAHLRRGDWLWNLIGRATTALLWCQPLVWWLYRRSLTVAEEICDDYVIEYGCNRESYLEQLVEIAERSLPLVGATGVSMVGFRSKLGNRAIRILDTTRALSTRAGRRFVCFIASVSLMATLGASLIEIGQPTSASADEPLASETSKGSASEMMETLQHESASRVDGDVVRTHQDKVFDSSGTPIAGVDIFAESINGNINAGDFSSTILAATKSLKDGTFTLAFQKGKGMNHLVAICDGYGIKSVNLDLLEQDPLNSEIQAVDFQLSEERPIQGRIVDTEGNPVGGVKLHVVEIGFPKSDDKIAEWIANERPELFSDLGDGSYSIAMDSRVTNTSFPVESTLLCSSLNPRDHYTDADGRFSIPGFSENTRVLLHLSGATIASRYAIVVIREMQNVQAFHWLIGLGGYTHYGQSPTIVVSPTQIIQGQIVDADTKLPLPNVKVELRGVERGSLWHNDVSSNVTNSEGRYKIVGASRGKSHTLDVTPAVDQPYFSVQRRTESTMSNEQVEYNVELRKTKWITGIVRDDQGKPVVATVHYFPFRNNPRAQHYTNYDPRITGSVPVDRISTDNNGRFRIQAIDGNGVLAASVSSGEERMSYMFTCSDTLLAKMGGESMSQVFNGFSVKAFQAFAEVVIDEAVEEIEQNLTVVRGASREVHLRDGQGNMLSNISVLGATPTPFFQVNQSLNDSKLVISGLHPTEMRSVILRTPDGKLGKVVTIDGSDSIPLSVNLEPCATVRGRVVDVDGKGVAEFKIRASLIKEQQEDNWARELNETQTDEDGVFSFQLPSGGLFSVWSYVPPNGPNISATIRPASGALYELGDLSHGLKIENATANSSVAQ